MTSQTSGAGPGREAVPSCAECGTRAEPGQSFCDSCGAVLGWTASATATPTAAAAGPDRARSAEGEVAYASARDSATVGSAYGQAPASGGGDDRSPGSGGPGATAGTADSERERDAIRDAPEGISLRDARGADEPSGDETADGRTTARQPDTGLPATADTAPTQPLPSGAPEPAPSAASAPDSAAERARSLLVPVADPEHRAPVEPSVAPVLPGRPDAARPQVRAVEPEPGTAGGVRCPWCSTPNRPDRHFCGRCALPMAESPQIPGQLPWWRRLLTVRNGETPWAGDRPRLRRGFGRVLNWVVGALVLALLITAGLNTGKGIQAVRDHFAKRAPVAPDSFKASRSYPGHGPQFVLDKLNNTWWGPGVSQSGKGEWLEARFDRPTRLLDLMITSGVSARPDQLSASALPHRVEARITTADGKTTTRYLTLDQGAGGQRRAFRVGDVTVVRFILDSAYGASADKQVSLAEIEFFGPSSGSGS